MSSPQESFCNQSIPLGFRINKDPLDILNLNLNFNSYNTHEKCTQLFGLIDKCKNLEKLELASVILKDLNGFPNLKQLKGLDLGYNEIQKGLNSLSGCENLRYIDLSQNDITDINELDPLKSFKFLHSLRLRGCPFIKEIGVYREKIFTLIPSLQYLDGFDKTNNIIDFNEHWFEKQIIDSENSCESEDSDD